MRNLSEWNNCFLLVFFKSPSRNSIAYAHGKKLCGTQFDYVLTAIYPPLSVALELEAQSKYRLCNPHFVHGNRQIQVVQPVFRSLGEMKIHGLSRQIFEQKAHFEASNFHSFLVPSRQISLAFVNGFWQSKSFIFSLIFKEYIFGMQIDFYSGVEIQLFLNRFSPSISLSSILAS